MSYVVDHGEGLLIVLEIKRDRGLVRQSIARGRNPLDQGAPQRSKRSLRGAFELVEAEVQVDGLRLCAWWLAVSPPSPRPWRARSRRRIPATG